MSRLRRAAGGESGATLLELLVTLVIGVTVMLVVLDGFDAFSRVQQTDDKAAQAQDDARRTMDQMVRTLRQARIATGQTGPVPAAWTPSRNDLIVATYVTSASNWAPGDTAGWVRFCTSPGGALLVGVLAADAYTAPGTCTTGSANGWNTTQLLDTRLQSGSTLFDYQSATCAIGATCLPAGGEVRAVGIHLAINPDAASTSSDHDAVLRDAVAFRNRI